MVFTLDYNNMHMQEYFHHTVENNALNIISGEAILWNVKIKRLSLIFFVPESSQSPIYEDVHGIETIPNTVYGISSNGIQTTPNAVYGISSDGIRTKSDAAYTTGIRAK